jgi:dipeptidyl aminopeptidase/acylaminoacyl peptidase
MKGLFLLLQLSFSNLLFSQISKPPVDTSVFNHWPIIYDGNISDDGKYVNYYIAHYPAGSNFLIIKPVDGSWQFKITDAIGTEFSQDNRLAIFRRRDSVYILHLSSNTLDTLPDIRSYNILRNENGEFLVYLMKGVDNKLVIKDLLSAHEGHILNVNDYFPYRDGKTIFLTTLSKRDGLVEKQLGMVNVSSQGIVPIWRTNDSLSDIKLNSIAYDNKNKKIAFAVAHDGRTDIWYYNETSDSSMLIAGYSKANGDSAAEIQDISYPGFGYDGKRIFVTIDCKRETVSKKGNFGVDVWSYKDDKLQSQQLYEKLHPEATGIKGHYLVSLPIDKANVIRLNYENEEIRVLGGGDDSLAFVTNGGTGDETEGYWNPASKSSFFLVNTLNGNRKKMNNPLGAPSPNGKFLYGFDAVHRHLYLYSIHSGNVRDLSSFIPAPCRFDLDYDLPGPKPVDLTIAGWLSNDSGVIVYDKYDIWEINLVGKMRAVNLSAGFGRSHHIILRLIGNNSGRAIINDTSIFVLGGYNELTKESGFFKWGIRNQKVPALLSKGPYIYEVEAGGKLDSNWLEAGAHIRYLVQRENASEAANYFVTSDFKKFWRISNLCPECQYNWLTSEVVEWVGCNKRQYLGVLYKPEDFDMEKRYPVIITYYERLSQEANVYKRPYFSTGDINIPWFVSHGYVVFTPDITYQIGYPGRSAFNSIVSGTKMLLKYPWVDPKRIGIAGHSWGGFETNYIITHSDLYAAALSASSITDILSDFGSLTKSGITKEYFYETDQSRMGVEPWNRPDLYEENNPLFGADKIKTPLLMMNNKEDAIVSFSQGVELFTAMRRLHKKVWMLQYDGEEHSVSNKAAGDYTIRVTQFFDYYLKSAPPPKWMTDGISARQKGIEGGLELDTSGKVP